MKPHRYPALLSETGPARTRTSMCSNMRALLPLSPPVLGSLYGARAKSKAEANTHSRRNAGASNSGGHNAHEMKEALWLRMLAEVALTEHKTTAHDKTYRPACGA